MSTTIESLMNCFDIERKCILSTCNLNQWVLDFDGNVQRTIESIKQSKQKGAKLRVGPELELCGYSCEDHFLEYDTYYHCYQSLATILESDITDDIICDIGCPIIHNNVRYNCKVICCNRKIILIRPKIDLADDGNYRERRYFSPWKRQFEMSTFYLPTILQQITGQRSVPMGIAMIRTRETMIGIEICEELWSPENPHIIQCLVGAEIICNGSGSHHQLRKLSDRLTLIQDATKKMGGIYLYSNHRGCDGNRLYFDGCSLICINGSVIAQATQFSLHDVEVITAIVDLNQVISYRQSSASFQNHSSDYSTGSITILDIDFSLLTPTTDQHTTYCSEPFHPRIHSPEEECAYGPACWMWDYLRRSGAIGFLLPLSGGADSSSVASIVYVMCDLVSKAIIQGDKQVIQDINKLINLSDSNSVSIFSSDSLSLSPSFFKPSALCNHILHTVYMSSVNSSQATRKRSQDLANSISAYHNSLPIDSIVSSILTVFSTLTGNILPRYESQGGSRAEDIALQNIQARVRMILAYLCAQLFPWIRKKKGFLLVLGSANVDEALRGYMTKYDCSSADINPIGGICKEDLRRLLAWTADTYHIHIIKEIAEAPPTAELQPIAEGETQDYTQTDEEDMGMTYKELGIYGTLRKVYRCGPVTMFLKLLQSWNHLSPYTVAEKVKRFFFYYSINRHKMTTLTPSYHAENYSPDDNRFDLRPFLYNSRWTRQFSSMDKIVHSLSSKDNVSTG